VFESKLNRAIPNGYAPLDGNKLIPNIHLPNSGFDVFVTGATYNTGTTTVTFFNNTGGTFTLYLPIGNSSPLSIDGSTIYSNNPSTTNFSTNYSFFVGDSAGYYATNASYSNFLGQGAGFNATNAFYSNFLGQGAGFNATNSSYSNFFGKDAGYGATNAANSNFLGQSAGQNVINASNSNFIGEYAGVNATNAGGATFIGAYAGFEATYASDSIFMGNQAGYGATNAYNSIFLNDYAGYGAINATYSFFGAEYAGYNAINASHSNFLGQYAGYNATGASYSNFIGYNVANGSTNIGSNNIIIGSNITLPDFTNNSLNIGGVLFGTGLYSTTSGNPYTGATGGNIGIGTSTPDLSAILDLTSTNSGLLLPRMSKNQRDNISNPVAGLVIFQIDNVPGLRVYNGNNWVRFTETID
jgi:hypothetical protein